LIAMLKKMHAQRPSREQAMGMMKEYIHAAMDRFGNPEHKKFFEATKLETIRIVANIVNNATPEQKEHFLHATQQWINDFGKLAR
jgi:hypothetical protein